MPLSAALDAKVQMLEPLARQFVAARLARLGPDASGLYNYYASRLEKPFLFLDSDLKLVESIFQNLPACDAYVEAGAGLGWLSAMIAHAGRRATAVEVDERRFLALLALQTTLGMHLPGLSGRLGARKGLFPCAVPGVERARAMLVTSNIVSEEPGLDEDAMIRELAHYGGAVVDLARFRSYRRDEAAVLALLQRMIASGLPPPSLLFESSGTQGIDNFFVFFDNRAARRN